MQKTNEIHYNNNDFQLWTDIVESEVDMEVFKEEYRRKLQDKFSSMKLDELTKFMETEDHALTRTDWKNSCTVINMAPDTLK